MNIAQAEQLVKFVAQAAPAQKLNDGTAAVWQAILEDVRFADAIEACGRIARKQAFIAPADIVSEVKVLKADRLDRTEMPIPNASPDDARAYAIEYRALRDAIRDGDLQGERLDAYRRGEISLTGRPALAGRQEPADVERAKRMIRDAIPRPLAEREAEADAAARAATATERARQAAELAERFPDNDPQAQEGPTP